MYVCMCRCVYRCSVDALEPKREEGVCMVCMVCIGDTRA